MRKYSATYILNEGGKLVENHTLLTAGDGKIIDVIQGVRDDTEILEGILIPGFINTHCHLELSNLRNKIDKHTQLHGFIRDILKIRNIDAHTILPEINKADLEMWENGIQGVGDISNTDFSFACKYKSKIRYHTFIELLNLNSTSEKTFNTGSILLNELLHQEQQASPVPHAAYTVPPDLFSRIKLFHDKYPSTWSIHNQETLAENELFIHGTGAMKLLFTSMQIALANESVTGKNSLHFISSFFPEKSNLLLVHNTFTTQNDIDFLKETGFFNAVYLAICINANLYIENTTPDIQMLHSNRCKLTIGTDSLASNDSLSVLAELKSIHDKFPKIPVEDLLQWSTANGASCLGWNDLGTFKKDTYPGVLLLTDASHMEIKNTSKVIRLH